MILGPVCICGLGGDCRCQLRITLLSEKKSTEMPVVLWTRDRLYFSVTRTIGSHACLIPSHYYQIPVINFSDSKWQPTSSAGSYSPDKNTLFGNHMPLNKIAFHIIDFLKRLEKFQLATSIGSLPLCMENSHWGGRENAQRTISFLKCLHNEKRISACELN